MNDHIADQRVLRGSAPTVRWTYLDGDGSAAAPGGSVTYTVSTADGTAVTSGTASAVSGTTGQFSFALTAAQTASLNLLTVVWTAASATFTTYVEIVGGYYFSLEEARASDPTLADTTKYPDARVLEVRREVEDEFEDICGVAFVPRYARVTVDGSGTATLRPGLRRLRTLRSARQYSDLGSAAYTALTAAELAGVDVSASALTRTNGVWWDRGVGNVVLEVEHGYDAVPPTIKTAALTRLRHRLNANKTGIPDRAQSFTVAEGGTFSLTTAGRRSTGIPDVDAELARHIAPAVLVG